MCAKNRHENWDRKMDGRGFSFNYERKLTIQCVKVNEPIGSSYIKSSDWLRWKHAKINPKISMVDVSSMLLHRVNIMKKSKIILKEYQILNHLLICRIGMV